MKQLKARRKLAPPSQLLVLQAILTQLPPSRVQLPSRARLAHPVPLAAQHPSRVHLVLERLVLERLAPAAPAPETTPMHPARACLVPAVARVAVGQRVPLAAAHRAANVPRVLQAHRADVLVVLVRLVVAHLLVAVRVRTRE